MVRGGGGRERRRPGGHGGGSFSPMVRGTRGTGESGAAAGRAQRAPDARLPGLGAAVPMGLPPATRYFRFLLRGRRRVPRSAAGLRGFRAARWAAGGSPGEEASPLRHGTGSRTERRDGSGRTAAVGVPWSGDYIGPRLHAQLRV